MSRVLQNRQHRDNHIVECVLAGRPQDIDPIAKRNFLRELPSVDSWEAPAGTLVPFRCMPRPTPAVLSVAFRDETSAENFAASRALTPERREAIYESRAIATKDECMAFRLAWIEAIMADHLQVDFDDCPGWFEFEVCHSDGRSAIAVMLVRGYCFTEVRHTLAGFFADSTAVAAWLDARGISLRE